MNDLVSCPLSTLNLNGKIKVHFIEKSFNPSQNYINTELNWVY